MKIKRITQDFSICKVTDPSQIDFTDEFCFIGKTDEEWSLVCTTKHVPEETVERDDGWKAFRVEGKLDFSLVGVLSKISAVLADRGIGIFAISTYNTDYILTRTANYEKALSALESMKYEILA